MTDLQTVDCLQPGVGKLERVKYFNRMLLTAEDMRTEQEFVRQKLRRHNRFLHGWGVVCGLIVKAAPTSDQPWRVQIGEGYALGPFGDEIFVGAPVFMDLKGCGPGAVANPCEPRLTRETAGVAGSIIYLAIKYDECSSRPVLAMPAGCGCDEDDCEYSRIRDSFVIECLADLPASHRPNPDQPTLCDVVSGRALSLCPVCPTEPQVVLARVALPASPNSAIADGAIDNYPPVRRIVFSTAMLQEQIIKCCCDQGPSYPPTRREADVSVNTSFQVIQSKVPRFRLFQFEIIVHNESATTPAMDIVITDELKAIGFELNGPNPNLLEILNFQADPPATWTDTDPFEMAAGIPLLGPGASVRLTFQMSASSQLFALDRAVDHVVRVETRGTTDPNTANNMAIAHLDLSQD